jgi:hypothetical protein
MDDGVPTDSDGGWDLSTMREDEFEQRVVYIVPDLPTEPGCPNRAESSLPRNLVLKPSQALSDVSNEQTNKQTNEQTASDAGTAGTSVQPLQTLTASRPPIVTTSRQN